eukprot:TRINITY_DN6491_c0_g2_i2.p1 TRINITY_DN6491_c0_g2~~TRINITY_DN6491_c0_g2_i2.p1  ORF type:complete len:106 (-),score=25.67 TRINITY_DN6491_c0_g2_i2:87-404(-)
MELLEKARDAAQRFDSCADEISESFEKLDADIESKMAQVQEIFQKRLDWILEEVCGMRTRQNSLLTSLHNRFLFNPNRQYRSLFSSMYATRIQTLANLHRPVDYF